MSKYIKIITLVALLLPLFWSGGANAISLPGLRPSGDPAFINDVTIKYQRSNAQKYKLTAEAKKINGTFTMLGTDYVVENLSFKLRANYTIDGVFIPEDSTLRINGNLSEFNANGVLLTANLTDFAYSDTIIGFNTDITSCGGDLAFICTEKESVYLYDFGGGFLDGFTDKKFRADGTAIATIPVPAAVWLFGSGLLGLASLAKRKKAAV